MAQSIIWLCQLLFSCCVFPFVNVTPSSRYQSSTAVMIKSNDHQCIHISVPPLLIFLRLTGSELKTKSFAPPTCLKLFESILVTLLTKIKKPSSFLKLCINRQKSVKIGWGFHTFFPVSFSFPTPPGQKRRTIDNELLTYPLFLHWVPGKTRHIRPPHSIHMF